MSNQIVWCDIPVTNLDRAIKFYSTVLGKPVIKQSVGGMDYGLLPDAGQDVSGCLMVSKDAKPSAEGPLIYLNCEGRLPIAIAVVDLNGGRVLEPRQPMGDLGFRAIVLDSEGNRIALHSKT
jgi:predicted enzyme related to lactoylglutathione lyase